MISARACLPLLASLMLAQSSRVPPSRRPLAPGVPVSVSQSDPAPQSKIVQAYGKLPLSFEANQGQTDAQVKFLSRGSGYALFLTKDEAVFAFRNDKAKAEAPSARPHQQPSALLPRNSAVLRMKLLNANPAANVSGAEELPGKSNYLIGNDRRKWHSNVPTYAKVKYEEIYPGVDLVYYGTGRQLEYDFIVAPGADPRRIQFDLQGAKRVSLDQKGDLVVSMNEGEVRWHRPVVYQERDKTRQEIDARYVIKDKNRVEFEVAAYDPRTTLFIDPLIYSTYLGGSGVDQGNSIAVDSTGNAYVTGGTTSTDFPTLSPVQPANAGSTDVFVAKLNPTGSALLYSTYLGGSAFDRGNGIAVDGSGSPYVTGETNSIDFPTSNPVQPASGGLADAFVAKLNPTGSTLVYSTYLGGTDDDVGFGIAVDGSRNAYITGWTRSTNFPTVNPLQSSEGGEEDAFIAKLNPAGSALLYSTYLGGTSSDIGLGIAVHAGNAYVTGLTGSANFPTMKPLQPSYAGGTDAFVAKLSPAGSALVYSTYLGGGRNDQGNGIAVDSSGNAYITGFTISIDFPTLKPLQAVLRGGFDAFVSKINSTGSALVYSTYVGGSADDSGNGIAVDQSGSAYVTGSTQSTNFRSVRSLQPTNGGLSDAFVFKLNPSESGFAYSTYLGGSGDDFGYGIAQHAGNVYVIGQTSSTNFPTINPLQPANAGNGDAFVSEISKP